MQPAVTKGTILAYRIFDAGEMIALDAAEKLLPKAKRVEIGGPLAEGLVIPVRPLDVDLGEEELELPNTEKTVKARVGVRVFDFGALSFEFEIPIDPGTTLEELVPICDALYDSRGLEKRATALRKDIVAKLGKSLDKPHDWREVETYTIVFIEELAGATVNDLRQSEIVAKLLLGETSKKSVNQAVREDVLKNAFSYFDDDLVIVDWNSALVVEPNGSRVVPFVLELATSQLLEFRYYDDVLDRELGRVYGEVARARTRIFRSPYGRLTRDVLKRFMELTEFTERVDNAIKSVGDFYLARVYLSAITRFRVPEWRESVESKLALVARAYELLKSEVETYRGQILEITVVILILVEVVAAFQRGH